MYEKIPKELKENNCWCCYRIVDGRKIPINARTGNNAKSNDESTWSSFDAAKTGVKVHNCDGIGYFFKPPYFGVDIDNFNKEIEGYKEGESNIITEFVESLKSYTEISQSGNGIHIICKGELPDGARRKGNVEMYQNGRYFIMTGNTLTDSTKVEERTEEIKYLHSKYLQDVIQEPVRDVANINDDELFNKIINSKQGEAFQRLYAGKWEGFYTSQSEADLAFANMLAFWTGGDINRMDTIFRKSALFRPKWDRKTAGSTYGNNLLAKAIRDCKTFYVPGDEYKIFLKDTKKIEAFDDTGNGVRFFNLNKDIARFSYIAKNWYLYNGKKWQLDDSGSVKRLADNTIKEMKNEFPLLESEEMEKAFQKHLKSTRQSRGKNNMLKEAEHLLPVRPGDFDKDIRLFNVNNGYLDLKTGQLYPHDREKLFSKQSYVEFTNKIDCPLWENFLHEIFAGDKEVINYIQKAVGYSLTGFTREQCMFILHGYGRNGKSVFLDLINEIMGDYATNIQPQTIMVKTGFQGAANSDVARLKGARFVTTTEPNEGMRFDEGLIKQLTGGDKVTARFLYENEFDFNPEFKIWIATNHKPIIRGRDDGIWRRMIMIPFTVQIPDEKVDKDLKYKLKKELRGILNWAVEGCLKWQREGLSMPQSIKVATEEYKSEMDVITAFIDECCIVSAGESVKAKDLYQAYKRWAIENEQFLMSNTKFGREIGMKYRKERGRQGNIYKGLKLNFDSEPYNIYKSY